MTHGRMGRTRYGLVLPMPKQHLAEIHPKRGHHSEAEAAQKLDRQLAPQRLPSHAHRRPDTTDQHRIQQHVLQQARVPGSEEILDVQRGETRLHVVGIQDVRERDVRPERAQDAELRPEPGFRIRRLTHPCGATAVGHQRQRGARLLGRQSVHPSVSCLEGIHFNVHSLRQCGAGAVIGRKFRGRAR